MVSGTIGTANEGGVVTLGLSDALPDGDGTLGNVTITGLANDLSNFNGGTYTSSTGTWSGTAAQFNALSFTAGEDGSHNLTISATTTGAEAATTTANYTLTVNPVAEGPVVSGTIGTANEGGVVTLGLSDALPDSDGTLGNVTITGLANDLSNFNGGTYTSSTGTWSGTAAQFNALSFTAGEDGSHNLTISATTTGAEAATTTANYTLTVNPVAEGPVFGGATSTTVGQDGPVTLAATVTVSDADDTLGNVTVTGLPGDLTSFNGGTYTSSTGTWSGTAAQFNALSFTAGSQGTFTLSIAASTTGTEAGSNSESYTLTVSNVGPLVSGTIGTANEGGAVTLGLTDAVRDAGDTLGNVTITGLANDLSNFNGGTYTSSTGTWSGTAAQFNALTFTAGEDGSHNITISATESGVGGGTTTANYTLTVNPVAEGPVVSGTIGTANEGGVVTLGLSDALPDGDGTLGNVTITGLANDLSNFNGGTYTSSTGTWSGTAAQFNALSFTASTTGTWTGTAAQFNALTFTAGEDGSHNLTISATTTGAEAATTTANYTLTVNPVAEGPVVSGTIGTANEGGVVTLGLSDALPDSDGTLGNVTITGLANDLTNFNGGTYTSSTGTWSGTAAQFNALSFTAGEDGSHNLTISATTTGAEAATTTANYTLTVNPVAEGPVVSGTIGTANEGGVVTLGLSDALPDGDGTLGNVTITGLANDLSNFNGGTYTSSTGTWSGTAAQFNALSFTAGEDGSHNLTISATTTGAEAATTTANYTLTVNPVAEGPVVSGTIGTANEGGVVTLGLSDALPDSDGTLGNVTITGLANDLSNFNGGTYTSSTGTWSGTAAQFNALTFTAGEDGSHNLTISATTTGAEAATTTANYTLTVNPVAEGPVVSGTIGTANEGGVVTLGLSDALPDGDGTLGNVTITGLANDLSNFNGGTYTSSTGTWSGTAAQFNALSFTAGEDGSHNLTISATTTGAEAATTTANYTLTVNPVAEGPVVSGTIGTANEGGVVTLGLSDALPDSDGTLGNVTITGLANDLSNFNGGTYTSSTGTWSGTAAQFNALSFTAGEDGSHNLTISATTTGAEAATTTANYTLTVNPVAEGPVVSGTIGTANEGGVVTLGLSDALPDSDGTLGNVTITGLANDLSNFNGGTYTSSTGTWSGTAAQFNALTFTAGEDGSHNLTISATTTGAEAATTTANYTLTVNPVAEGPVVSGSTIWYGQRGRRGHARAERCAARRRWHARQRHHHRAGQRSEQLQWRHLHVKHRHLERHRGAVQCTELHGRRGWQP